jgi:enamine deaminase RidA (YjgF/YER057c/UK114 family)
MPVQHLDPPGLAHSPAFTQAIAVDGPHRTIYVGGQNAVDADGHAVGHGDLAAQCRRIFANLELALDAGGARLEHVVKWTIHVVAGVDPRPAFHVFQEVWGTRGPAPVITVLFVAGLADPDWLAEIDAIAVVPL